ncbi:MAG: hypothetical protein FJX77_09075 [Armatimonadetes bacterium]|nr:hypothetical protein [Armatimonadota bacterium]
MAYGDFTMDQLSEQFGLEVQPVRHLVAGHPPVAVSAWLQESLRRLASLGIQTNTEKARSEFVVAPVLGEVRGQLDDQISILSGVDFNVDPGRGLRGKCDFLLGLTTTQFVVRAPMIAVVEAKNENVPRGVAQCLAELIAVQEFNRAAATPLDPLLGVVTTGSNWKFLRLEGRTALVDEDEYYLVQVDRVVGIFVAELRAGQAQLAAAARS